MQLDIIADMVSWRRAVQSCASRHDQWSSWHVYADADAGGVSRLLPDAVAVQSCVSITSSIPGPDGGGSLVAVATNVYPWCARPPLCLR